MTMMTMNRVGMLLALAAALASEHCAAFQTPATLRCGSLARRASAPQALTTRMMVGVSPRTATRTVLTKDIKTPDPIPEEGQQEARGASEFHGGGGRDGGGWAGAKSVGEALLPRAGQGQRARLPAPGVLC